MENKKNVEARATVESDRKQQFAEGSQTESGEVEATPQPSAAQTPSLDAAAKETLVEAENVGDSERSEPTPAERFAGSARVQAGAAADALRRGEFTHDATIDISADSDDRLIALLCYVTQMLIPLVMPILVLLSASSKKRPFQHFHAIQSLALSLVFILFGLLIALGSAIMTLVPVIGLLIALVVFCLSPLLVLMAYLALAYYGYQAYQGKKFAIPGLTSFLQDQRWI